MTRHSHTLTWLWKITTVHTTHRPFSLPSLEELVWQKAEASRWQVYLFLTPICSACWKLTSVVLPICWRWCEYMIPSRNWTKDEDLTKQTTTINKKKSERKVVSAFLFNRFVPYVPWELCLLTFLAKNVFTTFCSHYHSTGQNTILAEKEWDSSLLCRNC